MGGPNKAHTQFSNPICEDGFWVSSVKSSCYKSIPGFHLGGDSISDMGLEPILYFLASPEPAQCRGHQILGRALNPAAYSGDSTEDRETDSSVL